MSKVAIMSSNTLDHGHGPCLPADSPRSSQCLSLNDSGSTQGSVFSEVSDSSSVSSLSHSQHDTQVDRYQVKCRDLPIDNDHDLDDELLRPSQLSKQNQQPPATNRCMVSTSVNSLEHVVHVQPQLRQHPRRTASGAQPPPMLARQEKHKLHFVSDLVDSATSMVDVIWPNSMPSHRGRSSGRAPLTMNRYIEETLRRSCTSYCTLQVTLYYLLLFQFSMSTSKGSVATPAVRCGRRMFLAALILSSKYLQDRNYSSKAWSKMSGLTTSEINSHERTFLSAVGYKLHIPHRIYNRWTKLVLRFARSPPRLSKMDKSVPDNQKSWQQLVPLLTPDLDVCRVPVSPTVDLGCQSPESNVTSASSFVSSSSLSANAASPPISSVPSLSSIPLSPESLPPVSPPEPGLKRHGTLPTPSMTPLTVVAETPAVNTTNPISVGSSFPSSQKPCGFRNSVSEDSSPCESSALSSLGQTMQPTVRVDKLRRRGRSDSAELQSVASRPLRRSARLRGIAAQIEKARTPTMFGCKRGRPISAGENAGQDGRGPDCKRQRMARLAITDTTASVKTVATTTPPRSNSPELMMQASPHPWSTLVE